MFEKNFGLLLGPVDPLMTQVAVLCCSVVQPYPNEKVSSVLLVGRASSFCLKLAQDMLFIYSASRIIIIILAGKLTNQI